MGKKATDVVNRFVCIGGQISCVAKQKLSSLLPGKLACRTKGRAGEAEKRNFDACDAIELGAL